MRTQVIDRFTQEFGSPVRPHVKVWAWAPRVDVGAAVDMETPKSGIYALVWVPHPGPNATLPANAVEYGPTEGRHSNAYSLPGLKKGMSALRLRVDTPVQLDEAVVLIRGLPPIRSAA